MPSHTHYVLPFSFINLGREAKSKSKKGKGKNKNKANKQSDDAGGDSQRSSHQGKNGASNKTAASSALLTDERLGALLNEGFPELQSVCDEEEESEALNEALVSLFRNKAAAAFKTARDTAFSSIKRGDALSRRKLEADAEKQFEELVNSAYFYLHGVDTLAHLREKGALSTEAEGEESEAESLLSQAGLGLSSVECLDCVRRVIIKQVLRILNASVLVSSSVPYLLCLLSHAYQLFLCFYFLLFTFIFLTVLIFPPSFYTIFPGASMREIRC